MRRFVQRLLASAAAALILCSSVVAYSAPMKQTEPPDFTSYEKQVTITETVELPKREAIIAPTPSPEPVEKMPEPTQEPEFALTRDEINLIALVTMAEAEGEPELGQRLVIDTILNRVDSVYFPDTVHGVIYQENQFTCMWNGRTDQCYVKDELVALVEEELQSRTNSEVVFFRTKHYSSYGTPMFQVGHHYFSSYS